MRATTAFFVTTVLAAAPIWAGSADKQAANAPSAAAARSVGIAEVVNPSDTLAEARVVDANGKPVGKVTRVVTADTGQVAAVNVALNEPNKTVSLKTDQLRYVPFNGTLHASLPADTIVALPAASSKGE